MIAAGGLCAWLVYRYLGLKFVSRSWFIFDATWSVTLVLVGALSLAFCCGPCTEMQSERRAARHVMRLFSNVRIPPCPR